MSIPGSASPLFLASTAAAGAYDIPRSLRFESSASSYLNRTPSSAGNRKTWTWAGWVKRSELGSGDCLFQSRNGSNTESTHFELGFTSDSISIGYGSGNWLVSSAKFRDFSSFYHVVLAVDTTQSTASDRQKIYINGTRLTDFSTNTAITSNTDTAINNNVIHAIGARFNASEPNLNGYLADVHFIDGQALAATDFGELDDSNVWQPIKYAGTYGTNGFKLDFSDTSSNSALGTDSSGAGNNWSVNNLVAASNAVAIDAATGALPFYNTSGNFGGTKVAGYRADSSAGTTANTGLIFALPGDVTTDEHDHVNTGGTAVSTSINGSGVAVSTTKSQFYGSSIYFGGSGGISTSNSTDLALGSGDYTIEFWLYIAGTGTYYAYDFRTGTDDYVYVDTGNTLYLKYFSSQTVTANTWFHCAQVRNSGTLKLYIDGVLKQSVSNTINHSGATDYHIGERNSFGNRLVGYIQDFRVYKGVAKYTSNFSVTVAGTNGPDIDALRDSPVNGDSANDTGAGGELTGNYCTMNPLNNGSNVTLSNGNLETACTAIGWGIGERSVGTFGMRSGKWYWENTINTANYTYTGMISSGNPDAVYPGADSTSISLTTDNGLYHGGVGNTTNHGSGMGSASFTLMYAFDADNNKFWFGKNGTWLTIDGTNVGNPSTGANALNLSTEDLTYWPTTITYGSINCKYNFGQRSWSYSAPSGYKALCTANLSDPLIADGSTAFDAKLWTGNSGSQTITGYGFSPDLAWIKSRSNARDNVLFDTVRGAQKYLVSNSSSAESTSSSTLTAFNSDGFALGGQSRTNINNETYVGWGWGAGENSNHTYAVTVSNPGSGNKFYADGALQPTLTLAEGSTYKFDQSSGTNSTHPLRFSTTSDGTHGGGSEYTTGVTTSGTPGSAGAYTQIVIAASAPTLYTYCTAHSGMGFQVNTSDTAGYTIPVGGENSAAYNQTRTWSGDWTGGFYNASYNATKIFDGNLSTYAAVTFPVSAGVTLTVSPAITGSTIRVYYSRSSSSTPCLVNGTETLPSTGAAQTFQWYTLTATSISSFKLTHDFSGESYLSAIEVDGKMLVDSGVTPATSVPSISSRIQANPSAGFSIVTWTGTANATVAHGLNAAPQLVLTKSSQYATAWRIWSASLSNLTDKYLGFDSAAEGTFGAYWGAMTSTTLGFPSVDLDNNYGAMVAYCFTPVESYSSMGTYLGNGSADGPFVFTGFRPAFILLKSLTTARNWHIFDTKRDVDNLAEYGLYPNLSSAESNVWFADLNSNGFKIRTTNDAINGSGVTYLYYAAAEHPFKTARAR